MTTFLLRIQDPEKIVLLQTLAKHLKIEMLPFKEEEDISPKKLAPLTQSLVGIFAPKTEHELSYKELKTTYLEEKYNE